MPGIIFLTFFIAQVAKSNAFMDADTGWHLQAGLWMLEHGSIPHTDMWSFTAGDTTWYNLSWLFDILMALLYRAFGEGGLYALTVAFYSGFAFILAQNAMERGATPKITFLLFLICFIALFVQSALCRPQMATMLMVYLFMRLMEKDGKDASWRSLMWLPVLMVLWVNMHGGFLLAPFIFAAYLCEAAAEKDIARIKRLFMIGCVTAAAILANPYGVYIYEGVARTMDGVLVKYIDEWQQPDVLTYWYLCSVIACILGIRIHDKSMSLAEQLLTMLMLVFMLDSQRHGLVFGVVSAPVLCLGLTKTFQETTWANRFCIVEEKERESLYNIGSKRCVYGGIALVILVLAISPLRHGILGDKARFPNVVGLQQALEFIGEKYPETRWLNQYNLGGWLVLEQAPGKTLFIDGRAETAYPITATEDYLAFMKAEMDGAVMEKLREKYDIGGVMIKADANSFKDKFGKAAQWQRVYANDAVILFKYHPPAQ